MTPRATVLTGFLLSLFVMNAVPAAAQQFRVPPSPFYVKYGKWVLLGLSAGMSYKAGHAHGKAEDSFDDLRNYCFQPGIKCDQRSNGAYLDPTAEGFYQNSLSYDRQARRWLFGGEAALLSSAALFVWELTRPKNPPKNIPFAPEVSVVGAQTRLGFRVEF